MHLLVSSLQTHHVYFTLNRFNVEYTLYKKMKFFIKDFFSKCDQIRRFLRIWSHLRKKSLMKNFIFCAVTRGVFAGLLVFHVSHLLIFQQR